MKRFFPFIYWLPELGQRGVLRADVLAGLTVATILVPQAMAYAELAGNPANSCLLYTSPSPRDS